MPASAPAEGADTAKAQAMRAASSREQRTRIAAMKKHIIHNIYYNDTLAIQT